LVVSVVVSSRTTSIVASFFSVGALSGKVTLLAALKASFASVASVSGSSPIVVFPSRRTRPRYFALNTFAFDFISIEFVDGLLGSRVVFEKNKGERKVVLVYNEQVCHCTALLEHFLQVFLLDVRGEA